MMRNRKDTPDIISGLMSGSPAAEKKPASNKTINTDDHKAISAKVDLTPEKLINNKAINIASNKTIKQYDIKSCELESNKDLDNGLKEKVTFNLSTTTIEALDDAWIILRRSKLKDTQRITKTLIVETAIKLALVELDKEGELSELFRQLKQ